MTTPAPRERATQDVRELAALTRAQQLFDAAFDKPRSARSFEYKAGAFACLRYHARKDAGVDVSGRGVLAGCAYCDGTAALDAFMAGVDEGHALWRAAKLEAA